MASPTEQIERLIAQRYATAEDVNKHAAVLSALGHLDPHNDDAHQDYVTLLRRLQTAIDLELSKWTSAPTQPPGPSGAVAVAEPQQIPSVETPRPPVVSNPE